jgi:hypothetical protein
MRSARCGKARCAQAAAARFERRSPTLIVRSPRHVVRITYACQLGGASSGIRVASRARDRRTSATNSVFGIGGISESSGGPAGRTPLSRAEYQVRTQPGPASTTWKGSPELATATVAVPVRQLARSRLEM